MKIFIVNQTRKRIPRQFLALWTQWIESELKKKKIASDLAKLEMGLVFLGRQKARSLNHKFRGKSRATDVLSFIGMEPGVLGELVFCPEVIARQAKDNKHSYQKELGYLVLHGVLHLLGYEHEEDPKQAKIMYAIQDSVYESLCRKLEAARKR